MTDLRTLILDAGHDPSARGRFAPSPTGRMHLGNIAAALMSYLSVKAKGGRWILRIEDIDPQRSKQRYADTLMDDLLWLGLQWDEGPYYQSQRYDIYEEYLAKLCQRGVIYPCRCTRAELMATQAPHESDGHIVYSGRCRPDRLMHGSIPCGETLRLMVPPYPEWESESAVSGTVTFTDQLRGAQTVSLCEHCGDFVVKRRDGAWAYQFAVAVDDALMGVTEVVRGEDLLLSTAEQLYVMRQLGLPQPQHYIHFPLIRNSDGIRLSKRDQSLSMETLRQTHTPPEVLTEALQSAHLDPTAFTTLLPQLH